MVSMRIDAKSGKKIEKMGCYDMPEMDSNMKMVSICIEKVTGVAFRHSRKPCADYPA